MARPTRLDMEGGLETDKALGEKCKTRGDNVVSEGRDPYRTPVSGL